MAKQISKEHRFSIIVALVFLFLFILLQIWNAYAPLPVSDWNKKEISKIKVARPDDFAFAVFGDNKEGRYLFDVLMKDINHRKEVSFAIAVGDLVPRGKRGYFRRFLREVQSDLATPLMTAIGNHDLTSGSSDNYRKIFGETYYSFQVGENYFIVLDATAESGLERFERRWLEEELKKAQASTRRFVFMHVPPLDPRGEGFSKCLQDGKELIDLFRRYQVTHLFASHIHGYFSGIWEGVPYTITGGAGSKLQGNDPDHFFHHFVTVRVQNGNVETAVNRIDAEYAIAGFFDMFEDYVLDWGLLSVPAIVLLGLLISFRKRQASIKVTPV